MEDKNFDNEIVTDFYEFGPRKAKVLEIIRPAGFMGHFYDQMLKEPRTTRFFKELCIKTRLERNDKRIEAKEEKTTFRSSFSSAVTPHLEPTSRIEQTIKTSKTVDPNLPEIEVLNKQNEENLITKEKTPLSIETIIPEVEIEILTKQTDLSFNLTLLDLILLDLFITNKADKQIVLALPAPKTDQDYHKVLLQAKKFLSIEPNLNYDLFEAGAERQIILIQRSDQSLDPSKLLIPSYEIAPNLLKQNSTFHENYNEQEDLKSILIETKSEINRVSIQEHETMSIQADLNSNFSENEVEEHDLISNLIENPSSNSHSSLSNHQATNLVSDGTQEIRSSQQNGSSNSIIRERMFNFKNIHSFWEGKCKKK